MSLGLYPTTRDGEPEPCFDPSRPSFYPYWWDTFEEGQCKYRDVPLIGKAIGGPALNPETGGTPNNPVGSFDTTISTVAGIVMVLGLASMAMNLYIRHR